MVVVAFVESLDGVVELEPESLGEHLVDNSYLEEVSHQIAMPDCTCILRVLPFLFAFFLLHLTLGSALIEFECTKLTMSISDCFLSLLLVV